MQNYSDLKYIKSMILDMDGVLWRSSEPIGDLPTLFHEIDRLGIKVAFATNNASLSIEQYVQKFISFGLTINSYQIVSSSLATGAFLKGKYPSGGNVFIVGEKGLVDTMADFGFTHSEDDIIAVIVGMDRTINYEKLFKASKLIRNGALFIGTNPDSTYPTPEGLAPGAGSIVAAIQTASGVTPLIIGKPFPAIIRMAMDRLSTTEKECLVVGDRIDTDILAGQQAGCLTALMLSGVGKKEDLNNAKIKPDFVFNDLEELIEWMK
jgi:4-nitrophenyl phosphatase